MLWLFVLDRVVFTTNYQLPARIVRYGRAIYKLIYLILLLFDEEREGVDGAEDDFEGGFDDEVHDEDENVDGLEFDREPTAERNDRQSEHVPDKR